MHPITGIIMAYNIHQKHYSHHNIQYNLIYITLESYFHQVKLYTQM